MTAIENLFLASDYVRTHTDLATMEGANEAARRAVNGILDTAGSTEPRCPVWKLSEPAIFTPARALDRLLFAAHRPPQQQIRVVDGGIEASAFASVGASVAERVARIPTAGMETVRLMIDGPRSAPTPSATASALDVKRASAGWKRGARCVGDSAPARAPKVVAFHGNGKRREATR